MPFVFYKVSIRKVREGVNMSRLADLASRDDKLAVWFLNNDFDDNVDHFYYRCSKCSARSRFKFDKCPYCNRIMTNGEVKIET